MTDGTTQFCDHFVFDLRGLRLMGTRTEADVKCWIWIVRFSLSLRSCRHKEEDADSHNESNPRGAVSSGSSAQGFREKTCSAEDELKTSDDEEVMSAS